MYCVLFDLFRNDFGVVECKIISAKYIDYLEGAIYISYADNVLLDLSHWDLADQLWAYIINLIEEFLLNGQAKTYFPDQPLNMEMIRVRENMLLFKLQGNSIVKQVLPTNEFFKALLAGAQHFFEKASEYFGNLESYQYELNRVNKLKKQLENL